MVTVILYQNWLRNHRAVDIINSFNSHVNTGFMLNITLMFFSYLWCFIKTPPLFLF